MSGCIICKPAVRESSKMKLPMKKVIADNILFSFFDCTHANCLLSISFGDFKTMKFIVPNLTALIAGNIREQEVFFTGTLEKAARNDQGLVRGWRQRFFQLNTTSLSYFTKPRGDRKGIIRVLGGGVRRMEASETGALCCYSVCCVFCGGVIICSVLWC